MPLLLAAALAAAPAPCAVDATVTREPSLIGAADTRPLMTALLAGFRRSGTRAAPLRWDFPGDQAAIGALMFGRADVVTITRPFAAAELAPYEHQYHGDMMAAPFAVRIGSVGGKPLWLAFNRRPDSPPPRDIAALLDYALGDAGQAAIGQVSGASPLDAPARAGERQRLAGFVAPLDPGLPAYRPIPHLSGHIDSVGSDGMKALMDSWECRFHALQPGVAKGEQWEHLGTLNGFHALLAGVATIAPMGRELWPEERAAWAATFGMVAPVEIAVARGGFDTPQRTTAQAIFVHPSNPLAALSVEQLRAIFGADPSITRWGQLGLTGEWADRPIHVRMPPHVAPNAMSMQMMVLGGRPWNAAAVEAPIAATAAALTDDPAAIGFGGLEEGAPGLRALAIAPAGGAAPVPLTPANAASGRYPLTRYMYIRLAPGRPSAATGAFLRFILSRDGQERVRYSGYFPLSAAEASRQLAVLDAVAR